MLVESGSAVLPGDVVVADVERDVPDGKSVRVGAGIRREGAALVACKQGVLRDRPKLHVDADRRRYVPLVGDVVVGTVVERAAGELYRVDIGAASSAVLPALAFEGATKRNRPNLKAGAIVYARVVATGSVSGAGGTVAAARSAPSTGGGSGRGRGGATATLVTTPTMAELSCAVPGSSKSWVTGECTFGQLDGGNIAHVSLSLARGLLRRDRAVLDALGRDVAYEIAVGVNGRVWINAARTDDVVLVQNAVVNSEFLDRDETTRLVRRMLQVVRAQRQQRAPGGGGGGGGGRRRAR